MKLLAKAGCAAFVAVIGAAVLHAAPDVTPNDGKAKSSALSDLLAQSTSIREHSVKIANHVKNLQTKARKEKDVIKLNCVNDKLVQIKPQLNVLDSAQTTLQNSNDGEDRNVVFTDITNSGESIRRLGEEADQCVGEPGLGTDSSSGFTGPDMPDSPYGNPFDPVIEPPGYASPFS